MTNRIPMTPKGKALLEVRLQHCVDVERPKIIKDIEEARAHGDLSENSEYHDAKERHSLNEGRIKDLEAKISLAQIIRVQDYEPTEDSERRVMFGCTVFLLDEDENEECWKIVGEDEANLKEKKISIRSPLARALLGKEEGESFLFSAPKRRCEYEILEVLYQEEDPLDLDE